MAKQSQENVPRPSGSQRQVNRLNAFVLEQKIMILESLK